MFCRKCGEPLKDGALFCTNCGEKVLIASAPEPKPVPEEPIRPRIQKSAGSRTQRNHTGVLLPVMVIVLVLAMATAGGYFARQWYQEWSEKRDASSEDVKDGKDDTTEEPDASEEEALAKEAKKPETDAEEPEASAEEPEAFEEEPAEAPSQYFLPTSDREYLSREDLEGFNEADCRIARNELYARYGRRFSDPNLQAYFDACDWYEGTVAPEDFDDSVMNEYEIANRDLIVQYEKEMGYR